jgi:hypothetical protein
MAAKSPTVGQSSPAEAEAETSVIVRDPTFVRVVADRSLLASKYADASPDRFAHLIQLPAQQLDSEFAWLPNHPSHRHSQPTTNIDFAELLQQARPEILQPGPRVLWSRRDRYVHEKAIQARIADLRADAAEDDSPFDENSAAHLAAFCHSLAPVVRPAIFLLQPGTLRAVWQDAAKERQIGLQFLADGTIQYVLLRPGKRSLLKSLGIDTPLVVRQIVVLLRLDHLWLHG